MLELLKLYVARGTFEDWSWDWRKAECLDKTGSTADWTNQWSLDESNQCRFRDDVVCDEMLLFPDQDVDRVDEADLISRTKNPTGWNELCALVSELFLVEIATHAEVHIAGNTYVDKVSSP
jgi:hypothetical protein